MTGSRPGFSGTQRNHPSGENEQDPKPSQPKGCGYLSKKKSLNLGETQSSRAVLGGGCCCYDEGWMSPAKCPIKA
jgi:hypothetical protein